MERCFEDLEVWKRSKCLAVEVYRALGDCKDWGFKDQITRAALSVPSNIAEGAERLTPNEFVQFLGYAKGSLGELRTQMMIGGELGYLPDALVDRWIHESRELSRMVVGLVRSLR